MTLQFFFSRRKAIQADDREVVFRLELGPMLIESKFGLREMVYQHGLAL
jgi:hypothetical protein